MKTNLGQLLTEKGLISQKDLAEALQRQVVFGGRLGTNLMEMGSISEEDLMRVLADQHHISYARPVHFRSIPQHVLESVPRDLVARHRIVPLALEGNRITLAMRDPQDVNVLDEVSFKTGKAISPIVASELRIVQALEKYYGIRREARYVYVAPSEETAPGRESAAGPGDRKDQGRECGGEEVIELTEKDSLPVDPFDPTAVNEAFLNIRNRDEVALNVIRTGLEFLDDVFLFILKGDRATGWMSGGSSEPVMDFGDLSYPVTPSNALGKVRKTRTLERFEGAALFRSDPWLQELSSLTPREVIICPLMLRDRVVSFLVGFGFHNPLQDMEAEYLVRVMRKASVAFEILILKSRVVML